MTERESLLRKLSAQRFAQWDADLFLDTHPDCAQALEARREFAAQGDILQKEFNEKFGMLTHSCPESGNRWQWVCDPWPWDL